MTTKAQRFAEKQDELRSIANSLGRADIFDRDLRGEAGMDRVPAGSDQAIDDAVDGVGWYLQEEHEIDGEAGYAQDPRTAQFGAIRRYVDGR